MWRWAVTAGWIIFVLLLSCSSTADSGTLSLGLRQAGRLSESPGEIKGREVELGCHSWMLTVGP